MIPDGWCNARLGDLVEGSIRNGYSPNSSDRKTGYWVLSLGALTDAGINSKEIKPVEPEQKVLQSLLYEGDFLISRSNTPDKVGRSIRFMGEIQNCSYPDLMMRFRANEKVISPRYLEAVLKSFQIRMFFKRSAAGSSRSMVKITKTTVEKTPILLPPLLEQKKIAQILSTWDKAIETVEKLIANSQQKKKALMQQLLTGKKRFPEFDGEWKEVRLGDISRITTGSSNREDSSLDGEFTFFDRSEDIRTSSRYLFDSEAVIIPGEGQKFVPKHFKGKFDLHQRTYAIMDYKNAVGKFLYYYIGYYQHYFLSQAVGSTVKSLRLPMFQKMPLRLPHIVEQQKIASVLSSADQEIKTWQQELEHLNHEKKALMQQLLTGKRQVKLSKTGDPHA